MANFGASYTNEMWPFVLRWQNVMRLKGLGHPDPIGDMDLYSFDMIGEIQAKFKILEAEQMKAELMKAELEKGGS